MLTRRIFLRNTLATGAALIGPACSDAAPHGGATPPPDGASPGSGSSGSTGEGAPDATSSPDAGGVGPTPSCIETEDDALGPYYTPGAPVRTSLVDAGMAGTRLVITGRVLGAGRACAALGGAELDVWQANDAGDYDNAGFTLRGRFVAEADGRYRIETIVPGRYLDGASYRPRHIHVIVRAPGKSELTTQLYFEGDPFNASDGLFKPSLAMKTAPDGAGGEAAAFDFFLA